MEVRTVSFFSHSGYSLHMAFCVAQHVPLCVLFVAALSTVMWPQVPTTASGQHRTLYRASPPPGHSFTHALAIHALIVGARQVLEDSPRRKSMQRGVPDACTRPARTRGPCCVQVAL